MEGNDIYVWLEMKKHYYINQFGHFFTSWKHDRQFSLIVIKETILWSIKVITRFRQHNLP